MSKILGLDLGTNSIGWAVVEKKDGKFNYVHHTDEYDNIIPSKGSYIFPKGTEPNEASKAATRRSYRSARKRINRIRQRKVATLKVLSEHGMCPTLSSEELKNWRHKKVYPCNNSKFIEWQRTGYKGGDSSSEIEKQPYYLRFLAATKNNLMNTESGKYQLGRAFYHICQRRGYLSQGEEELLDDSLEKFKKSLLNLLEESQNISSFFESFGIISDQFSKDKKVKTISGKIKKWLRKETELEAIKQLIIEELNKEDNLGKVESGIRSLSNKIKASGMPTLGAYFHSIYAKEGEDGLIIKIRGRYVHREIHYLNEFNYICDKQNITGKLRQELETAIFHYHYPLKRQKGLVGKCSLEPKKKRIAISHPLFETFRMWESINRIKIKRAGETKLDFLNVSEKQKIIGCFMVKNDFDFGKIAKKLCGDKSHKYVKDKNDTAADIEFNFADDKTFSGCPTITQIRKIIGKDEYYNLPFTQKDKTNPKDISIEDIWHILFIDSIGSKNKQTVLEEFAMKHLQLDIESAKNFSNIKLKKGYGSLSSLAIHKILPFLQEGLLYSHAVFLANIQKVIGRDINEEETQQLKDAIHLALQKHSHEKSIRAIVNNCIEKIKNYPDENTLGDNEHSKTAFKNELINEIKNWFSTNEINDMGKQTFIEIQEECWTLFENQTINKHPKDIGFLPINKLSDYISDELKTSFPEEELLIENLYHPSAIEAYPKAKDKLGNPEISSIKNPVFNKSMHQIKRLANKLIDAGVIDKDTKVNIEMAREINSASYRKALSLYQKDQQQIREWARQKVIECYSEEKIPTEREITKYILFSEQNGFCLYTGKSITPRTFFAESDFDIEHTIPRSKNNDNSLTNKTLALAHFNRSIKRDILPANLDVRFEDIYINKKSILEIRDEKLKSYRIEGNGKNIVWNISLSSLKADVKKYKNAARATSDPASHEEIMTKVHYTKMKLDYLSGKYKQFELEEVPKKFTNANLVDTRIITRYARAYLKSYFNKVNVVNGKITDNLRYLWGLEGEFEAKDRSNHIHHCIDATVVACTENNIVNKISEAFHKAEQNHDLNINMKPPMDNFVARMKHLPNETFIYHHKVDRIKPMLKEALKEQPKNINLRGTLNSQNPFGKIKIKDEEFFVKRSSISSLSGKDIENIVDEGIKARLLQLAKDIGWDKLMEVKDEADLENKILENKKNIGRKIFGNLKKASANKVYINKSLSNNDLSLEYVCPQTLVNTIWEQSMMPDLDKNKKDIYKRKIEKEVDNFIQTEGIKHLLTQSNGTIILPGNGKLSPMVLKKIRLKTSNTNLYPLKERRKIDFPRKQSLAYKNNFYFDKEAGSNYEAIIYGDLLPNENGKAKRGFELINHYNIVKNNMASSSHLPELFKIHRDDMFFIFDKHTDEIDWNNPTDLNQRLFKVVKFGEDKRLHLSRHNYASGNIDKATAVKSESDLSNLNETVLRRSASTFRGIPTRVDSLGRIDIDFSKAFIQKYIN